MRQAKCNGSSLDDAANRRKVLVYVDDCVWPVRSGFHRRVWQVIDGLLTADYQVHIVSRHGPRPRRCNWTIDARLHLSTRGVVLHLVRFDLLSFDFWSAFFWWGIGKMFCSRALLSPKSKYYQRPLLNRVWRHLLRSQQFSAVVVNHAMHYQLLEIARAEGTPAILDMHDLLQGQLVARLEMAARSPANQAAIDRFSRDEIWCLGKADTILAINEREGRYIASQLPHSKVVYLPFCLSLDAETSEANESDILIVGSGIEYNKKGLRDFLVGAWPNIVRARPHTKLLICGEVGEAAEESGLSGVTVHRYVPELGPYYRGAKIVLLVTVGGTGVKIKTIEALAHGCCIVSHPHSVLGTEFRDGVHGRVVPDLRKCEREILHLLSSDEERQRLADDAKTLFDEHYSVRKGEQILARVLAEVGT